MEEQEFLEEKKYLKKVENEIKKQRAYHTEVLNSLISQKKNLSAQYADDFYTMDDEESATEGGRLGEFDTLIAYSNQTIDRLARQSYSPYFGSINFKADDCKCANKYYIGVNNLTAPNKQIPYICDWRAPVSSLFYDYELGRAEYEAPDGMVTGSIDGKRQYDIKNGELKSAFNSDLTISDDILKGVLSEKSSAKMKTIIKTIQKEQNKIIRDNISKTLLVQGVAGSGKTSIALHRVAYLLYQNRSTLKAEDVLILSPNKLFSEYISNVLPELGEENISQMSFYRLAKDYLKFLKLPLEKREDNIDELTQSTSRLNEVAYKNTYDFYESLEQFCKNYFELAFNPKDLKFGPVKIKAKELYDLYYTTYKTKIPAVRVEWIVDYIIDKLNISVSVNEIAEKIKKQVYPFFENSNILTIYADFLASIGMTLSLNKNKQIRYDDLAPLLYIADYFFGLKKQKEVKYLIIDEMQDYSFVHYSIFNSIFNCNKTILGDINQCIEKIMQKEDLLRLQTLLNAELIQINKAYRSTYEIIQFANQIKNISCECVDRHGYNPIILQGEDINDLMVNIVKENKDSTIAVLTKNKQEALKVYEKLTSVEQVSLNVDYETKVENVCIMPSYMAKGLEFDIVVIPFASENNYKGMFNKNLLYVSCTRALHKLYLIK